MPRGGPQRLRIPKPDDVHPVGAPPWAALDDGARHVDLDRIRRGLDLAPPPRLIRLTGLDPVDEAAVMLPLFEEDGEAWLVLTRRADHLRRNAGDVAFPGGRCDPGETFEQTARREAFEEIGLDPALPTVIGELDHTVTLAGTEMVPLVAELPGRPTDLSANPAEVAAVLTVRVGELLVTEHYRGEQWEGRQMHEFDLEGDTIWGATARILHQFLEVVLAVPPHGVS